MLCTCHNFGCGQALFFGTRAGTEAYRWPGLECGPFESAIQANLGPFQFNPDPLCP